MIKKKNFWEKEKKGGELQKYVHKRLGKMEQGRLTNEVHASDLTYDFCPREFALWDQEGKKVRQSNYVATALRYTFDLGLLLEDKARNDYFGQVALGQWQCIKCSTISKFGYKPKFCGSCSGRKFDYKALVFEAKNIGVSGEIDLIVRLPQWNKPRIIELKSMDKDQFKILKAPLAEHRIRTMIYMYIVANSPGAYKNILDTKKAKIFYMGKCYGFKDQNLNEISPFKEFDVELDMEVISDYIGNAEEYINYKKFGILPVRTCEKKTCKRAINCSMSDECFKKEDK